MNILQVPQTEWQLSWYENNLKNNYTLQYRLWDRKKTCML